MRNEYICDDKDSTPEYIQQLWDMTEKEFEEHIEELMKSEQ